MKRFYSGIPTYLLALFLVGSLTGCGGGGGDNDDPVVTPPIVTDPNVPPPAPAEPEDASIVSIGVEKGTLTVGESTGMNVTVTYGESRVLQGGERVVVVIKLPNGAAYTEDSSGIATSSSSVGVSPAVLNCAGGESYLSYDLGAAELQNAADPDGQANADFRLILSVDGVSQVGATTISAGAADNAQSFGCGQNFDEEATTGIFIQ